MAQWEAYDRLPGRGSVHSYKPRGLRARGGPDVSGVSQDLSISGPRGSALLLYDLHLLFVHTTAMHL
jgi:hypothetical protein